MKTINNLIRFFNKNEIFCLMILFFIIIIFVGTISQKYINIKSSQEIYFNSYFICFFDIIPFPGGKLILILVFINLIIRIIKTYLNIKKLSTNVIHFSIIVLLIGSFITNKYSKEYTIYLAKNEKQNKIKSLDDFKFFTNYKIEESKIFKNTDFSLKKKIKKTEKSEFNLSKYFDIKKIPLFIENNENLAFIIIKLNSIEYYIQEGFVSKDLRFEKEFKEIPFYIKLKEFKKINHEGTNLPKSFKSYIIIKNNNLKKEYLIEMNKPLRYNGYTFYQTSFIENKDNIISILTISKDFGYFFPYLFFILFVFGFLIHIFRIFNIKKYLIL